jgi:ferredoxin
MEDWTLPQINLGLCDRCGVCVARCPSDAVEMSLDGPRIAQPEDCTYCTECEALCPRGAIMCPYEIVWEPQADGTPY